MENKAKLTYLLNEEGRKKSLLAGGNGKELQELFTDVTEEILKYADVNSDGAVVFRVYSGYPCEMVHDIKINTQYYSEYGIEKPYLYKDKSKLYFSDIQTPESLMKFVENKENEVKNKTEQLQITLTEMLNEYNQKVSEIKQERLKEDEIKNTKKIQEEQQRELIKQDKINWITQNGSEYLKECLTLGYDCQRRYVEERTAIEFPDFDIDFNDNAGWENRNCPSMEALQEVKELIGFDAKIVWLTAPVNKENYDYDNEFEPCEAIVIRNYLGKYDLIKIV